MNTKIKRRQILVNKRLQSFFALQIAVFFAICLGVMIIDYFILTELSNARSLAFSDPIRQDPSLLDIPLGYVMMLLALNGAFFYLLSVVFSHRIAGPIINITRSLKAISDGDFSTQVHLRKGDYFKDVGSHVNQVSGKLSQSIVEISETVEAMSHSEDKQKLQALLQAFTTKN